MGIGHRIATLARAELAERGIYTQRRQLLQAPDRAAVPKGADRVAATATEARRPNAGAVTSALARA